MTAKIRHCAIWSDDYDRSSRFYKTIFGMRQFTTRGGDTSRPDKTRGQISDGIIGLALNPKPPGYRSGLDHFGFQLEDVDLILDRIKRNYPDTIVTKGLEGVAFVAFRIHDPVGTHIDIAKEAGENLRDGYSRGESWNHPRHLHHIAVRAIKPNVLAEFYETVFGLTVVKELSGEGTVCLTDGQVKLLIRPCENYSYRAMSQGLDHLGFKVDDLNAVQRELEQLGKAHPESAPRTINAGRNGLLLERDINSCGLGQLATCDPEGVLIDMVA